MGSHKESMVLDLVHGFRIGDSPRTRPILPRTRPVLAQYSPNTCPVLSQYSPSTRPVLPRTRPVLTPYSCSPPTDPRTRCVFI
ncbi:hypothetical protein D6D19_10674, partial [Aureobasidium pullulans]